MDSLSLLLKHAIKWRIASVIFLNNTLSKLKLLPHPCANEDCNGFALGSLQISAAPFGRKFPTFGRKCRCGSDSTRSGAKENQRK